MELIIRNTTNQPIYDQIYSQIKAQIIAGKLSPGEALPSIRALAKDLRISVGAENVYFEEKGAYTGEDLRVLCVCVSKFEEADLYGVVHELDPNAFFITQEGVTIHGNFIRKLS